MMKTMTKTMTKTIAEQLAELETKNKAVAKPSSSTGSKGKKELTPEETTAQIAKTEKMVAEALNIQCVRAHEELDGVSQKIVIQTLEIFRAAQRANPLWAAVRRRVLVPLIAMTMGIDKKSVYWQDRLSGQESGSLIMLRDGGFLETTWAGCPAYVITGSVKRGFSTTPVTDELISEASAEIAAYIAAATAAKK